MTKLASKKCAELFQRKLERKPSQLGSKANRRRAAVARKLAEGHRTYFRGSL